MAWSNKSKSSTSWTNQTDGVDIFDLLIGPTYKLLIEPSLHLNIGSAGSINTWSNQSKN